MAVLQLHVGKPQVWKNLDRLEAKLGYVTHRVSKDDPEVAAMFPEVIEMPTHHRLGP